MGATPSRSPAAEYYPWFDWLRAVCACMVMWSHLGVIAWDDAGNFAVQVFFALSGWLIGGILLKLEPGDLPRFYFNRAIRIWVPYYIAGALLLSLSALREPITPKWIEFVTYKATFVYNLFGPPQLAQFHKAMPQQGTLNHFWSVNAEEQFYLLSPLLLVVGARYLGRSLMLWGLLALATLATNIYAAIVLGVCAALVVDRYGPLHRRPPARLGILAGVGACAFALVAGFGYEFIAPVLGLGIVLLLAVPGPQHPFGAIFGGMSYPLYLNHWVGLFAVGFLRGKVPGLGTFTLAAAATLFNIMFAITLYWWIDRRLLAHRREWFTPLRAQGVTFVAYALVCIGVAYGVHMWPAWH